MYTKDFFVYSLINPEGNFVRSCRKGEAWGRGPIPRGDVMVKKVKDHWANGTHAYIYICVLVLLHAAVTIITLQYLLRSFIQVSGNLFSHNVHYPNKYVSS